MTVRIHTNLVGVTQEEFEAVHKQVMASGEPPKGLIFHSSSPVDGGWIVIDFWESRQDFDAATPRISEGDRSRRRDYARASGHRGVPRLRDHPALASAR